jgi:hypothetical protein
MISLSRVVIDSSNQPEPTSTPNGNSTPAPTSMPTPTPMPTPTSTTTPRPTTMPTSTSASNVGANSSNVNLSNSNSSNSNLKLGDRVWIDSNRNGIQDNGEVGLKGVVVVLLDSDSHKIDSTTTDSNGGYLFSGLNRGEYSIRFQNLPDGCKFTLENAGKDDTKDSDANINGNIFGIDLKATDLTQDAGVICQINSNSNLNDKNSTSSLDDNCECDDYESSIPALGTISTILMLLFFAVLGFSIHRKEYI